MAKQEVSDYLLERLRAWDVEHVFGYPGDGINGLLAAFGRANNQPMFVQSRHEEMSAFEAVGYAKFSGRVGVCMAHPGLEQFICSMGSTTRNSITYRWSQLSGRPIAVQWADRINKRST